MKVHASCLQEVFHIDCDVTPLLLASKICRERQLSRIMGYSYLANDRPVVHLAYAHCAKELP